MSQILSRDANKIGCQVENDQKGIFLLVRAEIQTADLQVPKQMAYLSTTLFRFYLNVSDF